MQPTSVLKNVKILPPDPQKGDILYRHREPFGRVERVGQEMKILELHPAYAGNLKLKHNLKEILDSQHEKGV